MTADADEACNRALGEMGRWQVRGILLVALVKIPAAWQMASILFTAPRPEQFRCASPTEFLSRDQQEWMEPVHHNTSGVSVHSLMFC
jgi:hypothetical protein